MGSMCSNTCRQPLCTWDQVAPRSWIRQVYCFELQQSSPETVDILRQALTVALDGVAKQFPDFAGSLVLGTNPPGRLEIRASPSDRISLQVLDHGTGFRWSYAELKSAGFPAKAFVGPAFELPHQLHAGDAQGLPVTEIHARVIDGGLLLCIYIHHSVTDGLGATRFIAALAAHTRALNEHPSRICEAIFPAKRRADLAADVGSALMQRFTFEELMQMCPEYCILPRPTGPSVYRSSAANPPLDSMPKTGRIFAFGREKITVIRNASRIFMGGTSMPGNRDRYPSTFACVAALAWACITTVRLEASKIDDLGHGTRRSSATGQRMCHLLLPASWARRVSANLASHQSGNAVGMAEVKRDAQSLLAAACSSPKAVSLGDTALVSLVASIEDALAGLDDDFVATRTAMMRAAPDPRLIGVNLDPQDPRDFIVNSWRHLGADIEWGLPGIATSPSGRSGCPDAVRRSQGAWNMSAGLILPGPKEIQRYEMLVTLDTASMERLCQNSGWRRWVDGVVE